MTDDNKKRRQGVFSFLENKILKFFFKTLLTTRVKGVNLKMKFYFKKWNLRENYEKIFNIVYGLCPYGNNFVNRLHTDRKRRF